MTDSNDDKALFLDDVFVGQTFESETYRIDEAQIKAFARQFDPQPFHLDDEAARNTIFGGLAASGWHTAAITMRLITGIRPIFGSGVIGLGAEVAWPRPVRPNDELRVVMKIEDITLSKSRTDRGVVALSCETFNQRGEVVQTLKPKLLMFRRDARRT